MQCFYVWSFRCFCLLVFAYVFFLSPVP